MASKFDTLRQGGAVEVKPGVSARLNPEKRRLELSTGEFFDVGDHPDLFPKNDQETAISREKEQIQRGIGKNPLGEFGFQFSQQGLLGGAKDWADYATQGKNYAARKAAQHQVSQQISEESPYTSAAATAASFIPDIALTRGMSAMTAAPILAAGSAGSRLVTEPGEVAKEAAIGAAGGKGLDILGGYFNRVAARRGAHRALPGQQQQVREANLLGQQAVESANALDKQAFSTLKQTTKGVNEARLQQHAKDLNDRKNKMIQAENLYEAQKASKYASEAENKRLASEFKISQKEYNKALAEVPSLQQKAQQEYSKNVVKTAKEIEKSFPASSKISTQELGVRDFIDNSINKAGLAGTREGKQASSVLKGVFGDSESFSGRQLSKKYQAIEQAIQRSSPETASILNSFKMHLGNVLPGIVEDTVAYTSVVPIIKRTIQADVRSILSNVGINRKSPEAVQRISNGVVGKAEDFVKNQMSSAGFVKKLESGEFAKDLANQISSFEDFLSDLTPRNIQNLIKKEPEHILLQQAKQKHSVFVDQLAQKIQGRLAIHEGKALNAASQASSRLDGGLANVKKTYGMAEPVSAPIPPQAPNFLPIPSVSPPLTPPIPGKPNLMPIPNAPTPRSFTPQAEPVLPGAQSFADVSGDLLEKNLLEGGSGVLNNPLAKLAGLKYLLGGAAAPVEAAYLGMKGLTSPTAFGEAARQTFKQGGIQAIDGWARKYPSYRDGILDDPRERRSLTKEIEDSFDIPIEQKAVLQSKVNRGRPLQEPL